MLGPSPAAVAAEASAEKPAGLGGQLADGKGDKSGKGGKGDKRGKGGKAGKGSKGNKDGGKGGKGYKGGKKGGLVKGGIVRQNKTVFAYGNYDTYYEQRHDRWAAVDPRIEALLQAKGCDFFRKRAVLDLGCGEGFVTFLVANLGARRAVGVDIDTVLVTRALKQLRALKQAGHRSLPTVTGESEAASEKRGAAGRFPVSMLHNHGRASLLSKPLLASTSSATASAIVRPAGDTNEAARAEAGQAEIAPEGESFPHNLEFRSENALLSEIDERRKMPYDIILCLRLTKWVHLHWGDDAVRMLFQRCYTLLRPGGLLVLEAQEWESYLSDKQITAVMRKNRWQLFLKPADFLTYLVSVVGFEPPDSVGSVPAVKRPLLLLRRPDPGAATLVAATQTAGAVVLAAVAGTDAVVPAVPAAAVAGDTSTVADSSTEAAGDGGLPETKRRRISPDAARGDGQQADSAP